MGINPKKGYLAQIPATNTTLYTCPANTVARVVACTLTNDTTSAQPVTLHKVESGGSVSDARQLLNAKSIGSQESYVVDEIIGQILEAGDFINGIAGAADQITCALDVVEIT